MSHRLAPKAGDGSLWATPGNAGRHARSAAVRQFSFRTGGRRGECGPLVIAIGLRLETGFADVRGTPITHEANLPRNFPLRKRSSASPCRPPRSASANPLEYAAELQGLAAKAPPTPQPFACFWFLLSARGRSPARGKRSRLRRFLADALDPACGRITIAGDWPRGVRRSSPASENLKCFASQPKAASAPSTNIATAHSWRLRQDNPRHPLQRYRRRQHRQLASRCRGRPRCCRCRRHT